MAQLSSESQTVRPPSSLSCLEISVKDAIVPINAFFADDALRVILTLSTAIKILLFSICKFYKRSAKDLEMKELKFFFKNNLKNYRSDVFDKLSSYLEMLENYNLVKTQAVSRQIRHIKLLYNPNEILAILNQDDQLMDMLPFDY